MKKKIISRVIVFLASVFVLASVSFCIYSFRNPYVTIVMANDGGRLGDRVLIYGKAKWLAYKYGVPFCMNHFDKSEKLMLVHEKNYRSRSFWPYRIFNSLFGEYIDVKTEDQFAQKLKQTKGSAIFMVGLFAKVNPPVFDDGRLENFSLYEVMIKDPVFGKSIRKMLQPLVPPSGIETLPKDRITVAVHIRKGEIVDQSLISEQYYENKGPVYYKLFDISDPQKKQLSDLSKNLTGCEFNGISRRCWSDRRFPDKFPPEQYYVDQIKKLSSMLRDAPLYVHIFADSKDKQALVSRVKEKVAKSNIKFACSSQDSAVFQDLFSMTKFDCLIRSGSYFGVLAQLIGDYKVIMYPIHLTWADDFYLLVDKVGVILRERLIAKNVLAKN